MTSTAMFDMDQDFSFPTVSDSSGAAANLFAMSSPSLWRVSSTVPKDFFGIGHGSMIPSCSAQVPYNLEEEEAGRPSTERGGDDDVHEDVHEYRCHDRSETMDLLWEEFNFSDKLLDHRVPSNITAAGGSMRGLDELHPRSRSRLSMDSYGAKDHRTSINFNARKSETMERYDELIRLHLEPLDVSKKTSTSSDSGYSVSVSPKRQKRRAMMPKMVWKLLTLHKLARHKRS